MSLPRPRLLRNASGPAAIGNVVTTGRRQPSRRLALVLTLWLGFAGGCTSQLSPPDYVSPPNDAGADGGATPDAGQPGTSLVGDADAMGDAASKVDGTTTRSVAMNPVSNEAVLDVLSKRSYRETGFRRMNEQPFPSIVAPGKGIVLWVSSEGYEAYAKVSTDRAGSGVELPTGTMIVREVYSGTELDTLTLMLKLEDGAFALGGDWFYAATDPAGVVRNDATTGAPSFGLSANCGTCHLRRSHDDYLFGTPDGALGL